MPKENAGLHGKEGKIVTGAFPAAARWRVPFGMLLPFLLISFGLAWGILALFVFFPDQMNKAFGELTGQHPLFFRRCMPPPSLPWLSSPGAAAMRVSAVSPQALDMALLSILVWLPPNRHSTGLLRELGPERGPFPGIVSVFFVQSVHAGDILHRDQGPGRGARLEGAGPAPAAAKAGALVGGAGPWRYLGILAFARISFERHAARRLVLHPVFRGFSSG
jgi:hypothetical protein